MIRLNNKIQNFENPDDLLEDDPYQNNLRKKEVVLYLDPDGTLTVEAISPGAGTPCSVYHGITLCFRLPKDVDATSLREEIDEHYTDSFEAILNRRDTEWDGHNWRGTWKESMSEREVDAMETLLYNLRDNLEVGNHISMIDPEYFDEEEPEEQEDLENCVECEENNANTEEN